ncbi:MAG TPA: M14 metallopeptidase family protein, partial [Thermoanaerobaculia bacterium]|nr:M14 metallopeptidase family protein [Thermoanaerobaculia bacterium]
MIRRVFIVLAFIAAPLFAQNVPTPEQFLGYKLGDRFTQYSRIVDYFNTLAAKSPLITIQQFGETYEHRPLILAEITAAKNRNVNPLDLSRSGPAVVWLAFGVHGNETSSSEAAMEVASTLLNDPASAKILDNTIVLIDPLQNPDGRERYVTWFKRTRGEQPDANPDAAEHQEPWPGGRYNHYLIDMNRDWAWTSQRETRARVNEYRKWYPQVFVDFHEMGSNSTYFFPPDAKPINANLPKDVEKWLDVFGRANAAAFTERGWPFFVNEVFDLFYPGYGDSWPALHGAVGMTYEVAGGGRGGSEFLRDDGTTLTLAHRIAEHY